jgi:hypothetical protein
MPEDKNQALSTHSSQKYHKHFITLSTPLRWHMPALASKCAYRENHSLPGVQHSLTALHRHGSRWTHGSNGAAWNAYNKARATGLASCTGLKLG